MHQLMYGDLTDPERTDGIVAFHYVRVGVGVGVTVDRRQEPVPQNENMRKTPQ
jgi:hypothetical protein